jgi:hypothetical protein
MDSILLTGDGVKSTESVPTMMGWKNKGEMQH